MKKKQELNKTQQTIYDVIKGLPINGIITLNCDQFSEDYSISINYMATGRYISKSMIDPNDLKDDENIKIHRTWEWTTK